METPPTSPSPPDLPDRNSWEYTRNWGVEDTGAYAAWSHGATGKGVTVAVVDSGVDIEHPDLGENIAPSSIDIEPGRDALDGPFSHGSRVASILAAPLNGTGTLGIAYNANVMAIRADTGQGNDPQFMTTALFNAIQYAVENDAKIINLSLGNTQPLHAAFEAILEYAIDNGVIFAISAGNDAGTSPKWPGRYASDPRFAGSIIVVGAHDYDGGMSDFSNRAGDSASAYITAPGSGLVTDCRDNSCWTVKGTSYATPAVAGAMALLKEAFPNLEGQEIVDILLRTAADAGDPGTDIQWGRGKLDIAAAFQPIGTTSTPSASSAASVELDTPVGVYLGGPFGDAMSRTTALTTVAYDDYDRLFTINAGEIYRTAPRRSFQTQSPRPMARSKVNLAGPAGTQLSLAAAVPAAEPEPLIARHDLYDAPWMGVETRREALFEVSTGRMSFSAWQGEGVASSPFQTAAGDGFAALAQPDRAVRGAMAFNAGEAGQLLVSADTGTGDRRLPLQPVERDAARYSRVGLDWRMAQGGLAFSLGQMDETMGPLGTYMPSRSDLALPSSTVFSALGGYVQLSERFTLSGEAGVGRTDIDGRFLSLSEQAISSSWNLGLSASCKGWWSGCSTLMWEIRQPLRVENGTFEAMLADVPQDYFDPVTFSRRRFSASPSGRQIDMTVRSLHALPDGSTLQLEATAIRDEQHHRDAKPAYGLMAQWRRGF